jgi:hypothetical protein
MLLTLNIFDKRINMSNTNHFLRVYLIYTAFRIEQVSVSVLVLVKFSVRVSTATLDILCEESCGFTQSL